jgi:hypothetical protein
MSSKNNVSFFSSNWVISGLADNSVSSQGHISIEMDSKINLDDITFF